MSAHEIIPNLWLGDRDAAVNPKFIEKNNIKAVINCTPDVPMPFNGVKYLHLNLHDSLKKKDIDKMKYFIPIALVFLKKHHIDGKKPTLVHCHAGMQRSAAIVAAYLSQYYGLTINQSINLIVNKRNIAFHRGKHVNFFDSLMHHAKPNPHVKRK